MQHYPINPCINLFEISTDPNDVNRDKSAENSTIPLLEITGVPSSPPIIRSRVFYKAPVLYSLEPIPLGDPHLLQDLVGGLSVYSLIH